jgi:hypothetical protein
MLSAIAAYLAYIIVAADEWSAGERILYGLVWVTAMSAAGKLSGLAFARIRLHMLRDTLRRKFPATEEGRFISHGCSHVHQD